MAESKPANLYIEQVIDLKVAKVCGDAIHWKGQTFGATIQAIVWRESHAGARYFADKTGAIVGDRDNSNKDYSLGTPQMKVRTARFVGTKLAPELFFQKFYTKPPTDNQIAEGLKYDVKWSMQLCAKYFEFLLKETNSYTGAILAYNKGLVGARRYIKEHGDPTDSEYVKAVIEYRKGVIQKFNNKQYKMRF